uniref:Fibronectin type-III domain-containing protein 3a n=2 Tax=Cacopsylla melanoneura TaxID=428564 RepID=A0A8D8Y368_9HEMI
MDDRESGHGYQAVYHGNETGCLAQQLRHCTGYRFRLKAINEEGESHWSDEVNYKTLPSRPGAPARPVVKGKIHAKMFKIKWEPPIDRGGTDITNYTLELHSERGWNPVYSGSDTEFVCDRLNPGTTYQVRVRAESPGGKSEFSDPATITTEPVCPGACNAPRLHGKPRQTSLTLRWNYPEQDGGSPVTELELVVRGPTTASAQPTVPSSTPASPADRVAYKGRDTECTVGDLCPGTAYVFLLRAYNRIGHGPWSEPLDVKSGAAPPETPSPPLVSCVSSGVAHVEWTAPPGNGAPVSNYRLDMGSGEGEPLNIVYEGSSNNCDVKSIPPATVCHFRLQASNTAGWSLFSEPTQITTPPSVPGPLNLRKTSITPNSLTITWVEPANHGSPILHYVLETSDSSQPSITCDTTCTTLNGLSPHTTYRIKGRAVNEVGPGPWSTLLRAATLQLPPCPPRLECSNAPGHNHLKLKWGEGRNSQFTTFTVYMENPRNPNEKHVVYQGTNYSCKINKLQELTTYNFYITATNDAGQGPYSEAYSFTTCTAPPPPLKAPKISDIGIRSCVVEWSSARVLGSDPVHYTIQLSRIRDQDYKTVYRGSDTRTTLSDLEGGAEYTVRISPVRVRPDGDVCGSYSPPTVFSTLPLPVAEMSTSMITVKQSSPVHSTTKPFFWKNLSDQQMAGFIVLGLTALAVCAAAIMQYCFIH